MSISDFIVFLWNGGLNPQVANQRHLRQRRTVSTMSFLLLPLGLLLVVTNIIFFGSLNENLHILVMLLLGVIGLLLQAYKGWEKAAALNLVILFWLAPTSIIIQVGLNGTNWVWMLPTVLIANLVADRKTAIIFTVIGIATLVFFSVLTINGTMQHSADIANHANAVSITGSLLVALICAAGYTFRTNQIDTETMLTANVRRLDQEVKVRRKAERAAMAGRRAKSTFLTIVSHELRTPLNGVIGAGELLANTELDLEQQELIDVVSSSGEVLLDLINNVLDLSRLEAGSIKLEKKPIHLESVIKSGVTPLVISGREKNVTVDYEIADDVPTNVIADETRLRQIILNLCGNALKFTFTGSVHIKVSTVSALGNVDQKIRIDVEDTGIGISADAKEKLFQRYTQADSSTARRFGGSGLGLTIVAELVQLFDGEISLESVVGLGSTFTVILPLQACAAPQQEDTPPVLKKQENEPNGITVLLTDDNTVNRKVARKMLSQLGYQVVEATDGLEALAAIQAQQIDVILMDVLMPKMDGITATVRIREMDSPLCDIPIIGLTANAMPSDRSDMLAAGMVDSVSKPVRLHQLRDILQANTPITTRPPN